jgi:riboflavin synthase
VTGHIDGVGRVVERKQIGDALWMSFLVPPELEKFVAQKGSIAVDGVSLTVNAVGRGSFEVTLIPHTLSKTKLAALLAGDAVNLEVDLIARYLARLISSAP